jgi:hypothetical protein
MSIYAPPTKINPVFNEEYFGDPLLAPDPNGEGYTSSLAFGAVGDGVTDDSAAINAALNSSYQIIYVPPPPISSYLIEDTIIFPTGKQLIGLGTSRPLFTSVVSRTFRFTSVTDCVLSNIEIQGNHAGTSYNIRYNDCKHCVLSNIKISNFNSGISIENSDNNIVRDIELLQMRGTGIKLFGSSAYNKVDNVLCSNVCDFGLLLDETSNNNIISNVSKRYTAGETTAYQDSAFAGEIALGQLGLEAVGIRVTSEYNQLSDIHASDCSDNGLSITGNYNSLTNITAQNCNNNGVQLYGAYNQVSGAICTNNLQSGFGVSRSATSGGASYNQVSNIQCDGNSEYGFVFKDIASNNTILSCSCTNNTLGDINNTATAVNNTYQVNGYLHMESGSTPLLIEAQETGTGLTLSSNAFTMKCNSNDQLTLRDVGEATLESVLNINGLGSALFPSLYFGGDNGTGLHAPATDELSMSCSGTANQTWLSTVTQFEKTVNLADGSQTAPSLGFTSETGSLTGIYKAAENIIGFTTGGTDKVNISLQGIGVKTNGTAAAPSLYWASDGGLNTGFYYISENLFAISTGGSQSVTFGFTQTTFNDDIVFDNSILNSNIPNVELTNQDTGGGATQRLKITSNTDTPQVIGLSILNESGTDLGVNIASFSMGRALATRDVFDWNFNYTSSGSIANELRLGVSGVGTRLWAFDATGIQYSTSSTTWSLISDEKTKENIVDVTPEECMESIDSLRLVSYNYNAEYQAKTGASDETRVGFLANEIDPARFKRVRKKRRIHFSEDTEEEADELETLNPEEIYMKMVGCIQYLNERVKRLEEAVKNKLK